MIREHGGGPAVVLLHGSEPVEDWFALADVLARTYRVVLTEVPAGAPVEADTIAERLAHRDVVRPHALVGAGIGAYRALDLVMRHGVEPALLITLAGTATARGGRDLRPNLPHLRPRVYARVGALDRCHPPGCSDEITRLAPRATLEIVLACGHALLREDGPATVAAIARELALG